MDALTFRLAQRQFGATTLYHFIFVPADAPNIAMLTAYLRSQGTTTDACAVPRATRSHETSR